MIKKGRYQRDLRENLADVRGPRALLFPLHFLMQTPPGRTATELQAVALGSLARLLLVPLREGTESRQTRQYLEKQRQKTYSDSSHSHNFPQFHIEFAHKSQAHMAVLKEPTENTQNGHMVVNNKTVTTTHIFKVTLGSY